MTSVWLSPILSNSAMALCEITCNRPFVAQALNMLSLTKCNISRKTQNKSGGTTKRDKISERLHIALLRSTCRSIQRHSRAYSIPSLFSGRLQRRRPDA